MSFYNNMDPAFSQASVAHTEALQDALIPGHVRQISGRSERSVTSSGTAYSL